MASKPLNMKWFLVHLCMNTGLNTHQDYGGIETEEDILIYQKAVLRETGHVVEKWFEDPRCTNEN